MNVTAQTLIGQLPPYQDEWIVIHPRQEVKDIMREVCEAHDEFAEHYDKIALYFDADNTEKICEKLYSFCKKYIKYKEESEDSQTSALPTGILTRGQGDCKHYSGFCAGILDALNRAGKNIDWHYRFASYKPLIKTPHHVFVVVKDNEGEIWIDPTPGADRSDPVWQVDKKIKAMPLYRNIAGINEQDEILEIDESGNLIGKRPYWQLMSAEGIRGADGNHGTSPYFTGPFLALQHYAEDPYSIEGTDWNVTAADLKAKSGIDWQPDFVKWIYDNSMKFWNFYEPHGVQPGYVPLNLPAWYPHLTVTDDLRLTFDRDYKVDDYMNNEIHALTAWAQDLINQNDTNPFPLKTRDVKLFSQNYTGNPGNSNANLFKEHRGAGFVKDALKWLEKSVNWVKGGAFKIIGSIPRNAFLGLVGINAFNMAANMWHKIEAGQWDNMARKWEKLGGNPEKLRGTIEDGKGKKAILGEVNTIGEPMTVGALIAAAAPIIAAMLAFIKDPDGKIHGVVKSVVSTLEKKYPDIDFSGYDFLDKETNQPVDIKVDPKDDENQGGGNSDLPGNIPGFLNDWMNKIKDNPLPAVAIGLGAFLLLKKKSKVTGSENLLPWALIGFGIYKFFIEKKPSIEEPVR